MRTQPTLYSASGQIASQVLPGGSWVSPLCARGLSRTFLWGQIFALSRRLMGGLPGAKEHGEG
ncbi:MAG: hypothetical protein QHJ34_11955 [bacterium]|jgi:hypothetical protein|nr:hypothetical protein [candidate division KSB1 bacterium]MDH7560926.1 hypothetical protein [bacterium]